MDLKTKKLIGDISAWILGAAMIFFSTGKLSGNEATVEQFASWGYERWFMTLTGSLELLAGVGLFAKRFRKGAAIGTIFIMLGAIYTHVVPEGMPEKSIAAAGIAFFAGLVIYLNRR